jgi:hypothetical protein
MACYLVEMLTLDEILKLSSASRHFNRLINKEDAHHWRLLYMREFTEETYVDHFREPLESMKAYLKRSFLYYKYMRQLVKGIIDETNARRPNYQQLGYLKSF